MDFPLLQSGAVMQYPAERHQAFSTRVLGFLDGSEQRFRRQAGRLRWWTIRLDLLQESELKALENFFRSQAGRREEFTFVDPWTAEEIPHCSLADDVIELELSGHDRGLTSLVIRENRH